MFYCARRVADGNVCSEDSLGRGIVMPNWVFNTLKVSGDSEELARFKAQASQPYESRHPRLEQNLSNGSWEFVPGVSTVEGDLLFWNFIKPDDLDSYFEGENWYDWNVRNWGCKWEARSELEDESEGELIYSFDTAWSPAEAVFHHMVRQFPALDFELRYSEEQGWGGEVHGSGGTWWVVDEWDIPDTHEERMEHFGYCHCEELRADELDDMYDDCPPKKEAQDSNLSTVS